MMTSGSQSGFLSGRSQVLFSPPLAGRTDADAEKGQDFVSGVLSPPLCILRQDSV